MISDIACYIFTAWCWLKGHTYLNKPKTFSCHQLIKGKNISELSATWPIFLILIWKSEIYKTHCWWLTQFHDQKSTNCMMVFNSFLKSNEMVQSLQKLYKNVFQKQQIIWSKYLTQETVQKRFSYAGNYLIKLFDTKNFTKVFHKQQIIWSNYLTQKTAQTFFISSKLFDQTIRHKKLEKKLFSRNASVWICTFFG